MLLLKRIMQQKLPHVEKSKCLWQYFDFRQNDLCLQPTFVVSAQIGTVNIFANEQLTQKFCVTTVKPINVQVYEPNSSSTDIHHPSVLQPVCQFSQQHVVGQSVTCLSQ